ncbi:MAG: PfkB family carbohydrate kinase [Pseudomonadota bacterium]
MSSEVFDAYDHKILTAEQVRAAIGERPRNQKVIMCHGVFDVIHPGHLRHLIYAKSKADKLVVSLTADIHISKGVYRPHVPQRLRAVNMAAYEVVDYVVIDPNPTPIENIRAIKPDYFAKGYEYGDHGTINPKTQEEIDELQAYGGEVMFTPGDYVYSSSNFISMSPPDIKYEKLIMLLKSEAIGIPDLRQTLGNLGGRSVHVVGDTIVDSLTQCAMIGGQTKTPTISVLFEERKDYIGGAAIVAQHMRAAGAEVVFSTVLGDDELREFVESGLEADGIVCNPHIDPLRPTTNKNAIVVAGYRMLKVDTLDNASIPTRIVESLTEDIANTEADAVVFADFRHGIFNRQTNQALVDSIPEGALRVADSQVASRWGNITEFQGFDLVTPNEREARFALADQDSGIRPLASSLYDAAKCKNLIMKLGDKGVITHRSPDHEALESFFLVDSFVDDLKDAVGAGDALLAYATLALLASGSIAQATILGSLAAACECEYDGNIPVTTDAVSAKLDAIEQAIDLGGRSRT